MKHEKIKDTIKKRLSEYIDTKVEKKLVAFAEAVGSSEMKIIVTEKTIKIMNDEEYVKNWKQKAQITRLFLPEGNYDAVH